MIPDWNSFINADCMEYLKEFPDNYFDLAVVDPPYGGGVRRMQMMRLMALLAGSAEGLQSIFKRKLAQNAEDVGIISMITR